MGLTLDDILDWEDDNGEDFMSDGPTCWTEEADELYLAYLRQDEDLYLDIKRLADSCDIKLDGMEDTVCYHHKDGILSSLRSIFIKVANELKLEGC